MTFSELILRICMACPEEGSSVQDGKWNGNGTHFFSGTSLFKIAIIPTISYNLHESRGPEILLRLL